MSSAIGGYRPETTDQVFEVAEVDDVRLAAADPLPAPLRQRLVSLDALRGFDMLMIIGIEGVLSGLSHVLPASTPRFVFDALRFLIGGNDRRGQLNHMDWDGMAFEDLIFPLFVFMIGVSIVFSLTKALAQRSRGRIFTRILTRSALLYLFGLVVYHGFDQPLYGFEGQTQHGVHAVRWLGVLQRLAICYGVTATLFCLFRPRTLVIAAVVLLAGYWAAMTYIPVPGVGAGSYAEGKNLANYLDQQYLGGFKWDSDHDPEGYLSTLPAIASCLLGVFAGLILQSAKARPSTKVLALILGGACIAAVGYAWGFLPSPVQFPIIKKLWTSSFVLLAGGYSAMLLGLFYLIIDVWRVRLWAMPFVWIGSNAIALYMFTELHFFDQVATRLVGGDKHQIPIFGDAQELITAAVALGLVLLLARFLYRRAVFVRV